MRISDLRYGGVAAWPHAWTSSVPVARFLTGHIEAILEGVTVKHGGVEVEMTVEGDTIRGLLLWDGAPAPVAVKEALDGFIHRPLGEAAAAHIAQNYAGRRVA